MTPASVASQGADWTVAVESILEASAVGPERVAEAVLIAASTLTASRSGALVRWHSEGPKLLFATGSAIELPVLRPPEGPGLLAERPAATVPISASTDLVVARERREAAFDLDELRALRIFAVLGARAGDRSQEAFAALYGVATKLLASRDLEEVLLAITNATSQVLRAEIAGLFLVDPAGECLEMRSVVGHRTVETARLRVRRGQGLAGKVLSTGRVHRVDDWTTDPSITKEFLSIASKEGTQSGLCAPMRVGGRTVGVVCVAAAAVDLHRGRRPRDDRAGRPGDGRGREGPRRPGGTGRGRQAAERPPGAGSALPGGRAGAAYPQGAHPDRRGGRGHGRDRPLAAIPDWRLGGGGRRGGPTDHAAGCPRRAADPAGGGLAPPAHRPGRGRLLPAGAVGGPAALDDRGPHSGRQGRVGLPGGRPRRPTLQRRPGRRRAGGHRLRPAGGTRGGRRRGDPPAGDGVRLGPAGGPGHRRGRGAGPHPPDATCAPQARPGGAGAGGRLGAADEFAALDGRAGRAGQEPHWARNPATARPAQPRPG